MLHLAANSYKKNTKMKVLLEKIHKVNSKLLELIQWIFQVLKKAVGLGLIMINL